MSEQAESLLDAEVPTREDQAQGAQATDATPAEASNEPSWFLAEEIAGDGEAPEWFKAGKYKTVADQAKAYTDLEKRFGGFTGAPEDGYKLEAPEGMDVLEGAEEHPRLQLFMDIAKDENMSQEAFNRVVHRMFAAEQQEAQEAREAELNALGDNAKARLESISTFYANNLDQDEYQAVREFASTASGVAALEKLMQMAKGASKLPSKPGDQVAPKTGADLRDSVDWDKYKTDPAYRRQVKQQYRAAYGDAPANTLIG